MELCNKAGYTPDILPSQLSLPANFFLKFLELTPISKCRCFLNFTMWWLVMSKLIRGVFVWGNFFLLAAGFIACKTLVRQSVSDISAISDSHLTLGIVPIQSDNGMQAYRMLLCKKSAAYPNSMLEDDSRCRVALYDRNATEVAFLPNTFRRDFGTKYKGYAKKATILTLAIVPFVMAGFNAGAWRHVKKLNTMKIDLNESGKMPTATFTDDLIQKGFGDDGYRYYENTYDVEVANMIRKVKQAGQAGFKKFDKVTTDLIAITEQYATTLTTAAQLKVLEDSRKLVDEIAGMSPDKKVARLAELEKEIKTLNNGVLHNDDGSFVREFDDILRNRFQSLITDATSADKSNEELLKLLMK